MPTGAIAEPNGKAAMLQWEAVAVNSPRLLYGIEGVNFSHAFPAIVQRGERPSPLK
jgi:hypothetical protein